MGKRRLSRQQARRIEAQQRARANRAAAGMAHEPAGASHEREGLIVAHYGRQVEVEAGPGERHRCHLRANLDGLVTGDQVIWREGSPSGVVVAGIDRQSVLSRPDAAGRLKPIAANIDQILIVLAPLPQPHANLLDRYLVAAETVGIEPLIVLNKIDLLAGDPRLAAHLAALLEPYPALGYRVLHTSARNGDLAPLAAALDGRASVIVGQSGVGKSSLVNALVPRAGRAVGGLSGPARQGTHTTTTTHLLHLPQGGCLIDSPGIREFGLWHLDRADLAWGFREFRPLLGRCRFRDCHHADEPGCAVLAAADSGAISRPRLASFRMIAADSAPGDD